MSISISICRLQYVDINTSISLGQYHYDDNNMFNTHCSIYLYIIQTCLGSRAGVIFSTFFYIFICFQSFSAKDIVLLYESPARYPG